MQILTRDEFNLLSEEYYSVMDINEGQKNKRKETAWTLYDLFMLFFLWFTEAKDNNITDYTYFLPRFQSEFQTVLSDITPIDDYLIQYLAVVSLNTYTITVNHIDEEYYLSGDRAVNLALNESNSINNYIDYKDAVKQGYTPKIWRTELDDKVRATHIEKEGVKIPIDKYFEFPDCRMLFPHDMVNGSASELSNCRCHAEYS